MNEKIHKSILKVTWIPNYVVLETLGLHFLTENLYPVMANFSRLGFVRLGSDTYGRHVLTGVIYPQSCAVFTVLFSHTHGKLGSLPGVANCVSLV